VFAGEFAGENGMNLAFSDNIALHKGQAMPSEAEVTGCKAGAKGTHSSRTLMAADLASVLSTVASPGRRSDYAAAVIESNCLGKATTSTRKLSLQRLSELYGLDPDIRLFRVFRRLWDVQTDGRVLLALLIAVARDPLLATTAQPIIALRFGAELQRDQLREALIQLTGDRFNPSVLDKVVRNTASTWTQSGHLAGRTFKKRQRVEATAPVAAFALFLAHLTGFRGANLFSSGWFALIDCTPQRARELALDAKRLGLIDLRIAGEVVELNPDRLDPRMRS
jgi:hypothetical protein